VPRRKGISPVIATVIIVAVTIAVAIAVAFWMTGLIGLFTGAVEKLEIVSATATAQAGGGGWQITIVARNTGTTQTSVDVIFVNGYNATQLTCGNNKKVTVSPTLPQVIRPGEQMRFTIDINAGTCQVDNNQVFTANPGVSIEVKLHTTGGKEYPKLLTLP
jgi:flagellin-like protein